YTTAMAPPPRPRRSSEALGRGTGQGCCLVRGLTKRWKRQATDFLICAECKSEDLGHNKETDRMLTLKHALRSVGVLILSLSVLSPSALAGDCSMLVSNVDDARTRLKRAANETDFESAKDYARRAKSALEEVAASAMDCKCDMAHNEFDTAASRARRA